MHDPAVSASTTRLEGCVFNIQRCSVHDGPGIRTTVFFKGCPLACAWCHNPEGIGEAPDLMLHADRCIGCGACVDVCPRARAEDRVPVPVAPRPDCLRCGQCVEVCPADARELAGRHYGAVELTDLIERDRPFFDASGGGVTFSGGEPLSQPEFLKTCLRECRRRGLHTAVDTCGMAPRDVLLDVGGLADLVLFDLKHMDHDTHRRFTGAGNRVILENLRALSAAGTRIWIRVPFIPGVNDDGTNLDALGAFLGALPRRHPVVLLGYHTIAEGKASRIAGGVAFTRFASPGTEALEAARDRLEASGLDVALGGSP